MPGMEGGVFRVQAVDLLFHRLGQRVIGRALVGEFSLAVRGGNHQRGEQRILDGPPPERTVAYFSASFTKSIRSCPQNI